MLKTTDVEAIACEIFAQALGPDRFDRLRVETGTDHDGEPSFYVMLYYKPGVDPRDVRDESRAHADLRRHLLGLDEDRFPYLRPFFVDDEILTGGNEPEPAA